MGSNSIQDWNWWSCTLADFGTIRILSQYYWRFPMYLISDTWWYHDELSQIARMIGWSHNQSNLKLVSKYVERMQCQEGWSCSGAHHTANSAPIHHHVEDQTTLCYKQYSAPNHYTIEHQTILWIKPFPAGHQNIYACGVCCSVQQYMHHSSPPTCITSGHWR